MTSRESYWQATVSRPTIDLKPLPAQADVVVLGSGVTGLSAALTLARAGRDVVVVESREVNHGATNRNFGAIGETLKPSFSALEKSLGRARAIDIYRETGEAFRHFLAFIRDEAIPCHFQQSGRLICATSSRQFQAIAREQERKARALGTEFSMVGRDALSGEIGTDAFFGGCVIARHGTLHPGEFHAGLVERCRSAGVSIFENAEVQRVSRDSDGLTARIGDRDVRTRDVVVATNGYTGRYTPWLCRRLVPIDAFLIVTEPLDERLIKRLLPTGRFFHDANINTQSGRITPDGRHLLFGGLTGSSPTRVKEVALAIRKSIGRIFPEMRAVGLSYAWTGRCSAAFDFLPLVGQHCGMTFAGGYSFGSGLPLGLWLGRKAALRILEDPGAVSAFKNDDPPSRLYYWGVPWFTPILRIAAGLR